MATERTLWIRKNSDGKSRPGVIPTLIIGLTLFGFVFYVTYRMSTAQSSGQALMQKEVVDTGTKTEFARVKDVSQTVTTGKSFSPPPKYTPGVEVPISEPIDNAVSVAQPSRLSDVSLIELKETAIEERRINTESTTGLNGETPAEPAMVATVNTLIKKEMGDDKQTYLRTQTAIYTRIAEAGQRLQSVGPASISVTVSDSLRPVVQKTVDNSEELSRVKGRLIGSNGVYEDDGTVLHLVAPSVTNNSFRGVDGRDYLVSSAGDVLESSNDGKTRPTTLMGEGEFRVNGRSYLLSSGELFVTTDIDVSFGSEILRGIGEFKDPSGRTLIRGADRGIYIVKGNSENSKNLVHANIRGMGTFLGPDGSLFLKDSSHRIKLINAVPGSRPEVSETEYTGVVQPKNTKKPQRTREVSASVNGQAYTANNLSGTTEDGKPIDLGGQIVALPKSLAENVVEQAARIEVEQSVSPLGHFLPVTQPIPFTTLTTVSSQFTGSNFVEAMVSENVFFQGAQLPAGTKLLGISTVPTSKQNGFTDFGGNNRIRIQFHALLFTNGKQLPLAGEVFDVDLNPGIEAYYIPTPPWVIGTKFATAYAVYAMSTAQQRAASGSTGAGAPVGDISAITAPILEMQAGLEQRYAGYYVLPKGSVGILKLTADLDLQAAGYNAANRPPAKALGALQTVKEAGTSTTMGPDIAAGMANVEAIAREQMRAQDEAAAKNPPTTLPSNLEDAFSPR